MKHILLLIGFIFLVSCGGGGANTSPSTQTSSAETLRCGDYKIDGTATETYIFSEFMFPDTARYCPFTDTLEHSIFVVEQTDCNIIITTYKNNFAEDYDWNGYIDAGGDINLDIDWQDEFFECTIIKSSSNKWSYGVGCINKDKTDDLSKDCLFFVY